VKEETTSRIQPTATNASPSDSHSATSPLRHSATSSAAAFGGGCDILTIGQYLQPTRNHLPIDRWVTPEQFRTFQTEGLARGFKVVESGPLVRSSYHADHQADELTTISDERDRQNHARMAELLRRT
jgi:hypothetical protein